MSAPARVQALGLECVVRETPAVDLPVAAAGSPRRPSFLFASATARLAAAGAVASLLWLGVAWALLAAA